jgi:hypothetical protein
MPSSERQQVRVCHLTMADHPAGESTFGTDYEFYIIKQEDVTLNLPDPAK